MATMFYSTAAAPAVMFCVPVHHQGKGALACVYFIARSFALVRSSVYRAMPLYYAACLKSLTLSCTPMKGMPLRLSMALASSMERSSMKQKLPLERVTATGLPGAGVASPTC